MGRKNKDDREFLCLDCGAHTGKLCEYVILHEDVWLAANPKHDGMLCIGCIEARLGRTLTYDDFAWVPINLNAMIHGSERLKERMDANGMLANGLADISLSDLAFAIADAIVSEHEKVEAILTKHGGVQ